MIPKFRAFYKPLKVMLDTDKIESINFETKTLGVYTPIENKNFHKFRMSDFELMQYTGLKDKNGKEIYEGDVIKDSFGDRLGKIRYSTYSASFELYDYDGIHLLSSHNGENFFEVIGNIYENPELLEATS